MNFKDLAKSAIAAAFGSLLYAASSAGEQKYLNRSIYLPVTFVTCEHLGDALYYENERVMSTVPVSRMFQFTYYPDLKRLLPTAVPIRVEGHYLDNDEPFVARVSVTAEAFVTADGRQPFDIEQNLKKLGHKRDVRNDPVALKLACSRFCSRRLSESVTELPGTSAVQTEEPDERELPVSPVSPVSMDEPGEPRTCSR